MNKPPETRYFVPDPTVLLCGCSAFVPDHGDGQAGEPAPFRAVQNPDVIGESAPTGKVPHGFDGAYRPTRKAWKPGRCPTCRGHIEDDEPGRRDRVYCCRCDAMSDRNETYLAMQARIRAEEVEARNDHDAELADLERITRKKAVLSELMRRRIWNGYKGGTADALRLPAESADRKTRESRWIARAKIGREWLRSIGQEPNWSLEVDGHGKIIGRRKDDAE